MMRTKRWAAVLIPTVAALVAMVGSAGTAQAASPGPIQIPFRSPGPGGAQCPGATYVITNSGSTDSATFLLVPPGPTQCAPGIDLLRAPGPIGTPAGQAVALPLTAASCDQGTALFNSELGLVGGSAPGPTAGGPGASAAAPCPSGDAALAALQGALANVPIAPGASGLIISGPTGAPGAFVFKAPGPAGTPGLIGAYLIDATGTARGLFVFKQPGPSGVPELLLLVPSDTPGVSVLKAPGPGSQG